MGVVLDEIGIDLRINGHVVVDELFVLCVTIARHGRGFSNAIILSSGHPPRCSFAVSLPMKLTTGIDQSANVEVGAIKQEANERVVVVEFGVASNDYTGLFGRNSRRFCLRGMAEVHANNHR